MGQRRSTKSVGVALIAISWILVTVTALEVGTRARLHFARERNELMQAEIERRLSFEAALSAPVWEIPFDRYRPHAEARATIDGREIHLKIDSRGFRTREVEVPKPPGVFRIVCVGASTTVEGETNETTYPALLESRLSDAFPGRSIEVINCGISGIDAPRELDKVSDYLAYQPDLVLEIGVINDVSSFARRLIKAAPRSHQLIRRSYFFGRTFAPALLPSSSECAERIRRRVLEPKSEFAEQIVASGAQVVFGSFPLVDLSRTTPEQYTYLDFETQSDWGGPFVPVDLFVSWVEIYNEELKRYCEEHGILYLPIAEELPGDMADYVDLCHMTPSGIERKAALIARHLEPVLEARFSDFAASP